MSLLTYLILCCPSVDIEHDHTINFFPILFILYDIVVYISCPCHPALHDIYESISPFIDFSEKKDRAQILSNVPCHLG